MIEGQCVPEILRLRLGTVTLGKVPAPKRHFLLIIAQTICT